MKGMGKRIRCGVVIGIMAAELLTGCGDKNVDYKVDNTEPSAGNQRGALAEFEAEKDNRWEESLQITDADGESVPVSIRAWLGIPKVESMSVVEVKEFEFTPENKQKAAEVFFGEEIYSYNMRMLLEAQIAQYEELIDAYDTDIAQNGSEYEEQYIITLKREREECQEKCEQLQAKLAGASETLQKADNFEEDCFIGKIGDMYFTMSFEERMEAAVIRADESATEAAYVRQITIAPEFLLISDDEIDELYERIVKSDGSVQEQSCGETEQMMLEKLQNAGFGNLCTFEIYCGSEGDRKTLDEKREIYGAEYWFTMGLGADGQPFESFGTSEDYLPQTLMDQHTNVYYQKLTEEVEAMVYDPEIFRITIENPVEVVSVTSDVSLLSLNNIKEILKNEITEQVDFAEYSHGASITLDQLDLIYFRVEDKENAGCYSFVPAWRLSDGGYDFVVMVNAIDGSVIDVFQELLVEED